MRLRLNKLTPPPSPGEKGWRLLEQGELTIGRADGCDWVLPDPERRISGVHCRIGRDATGFWLKDESTNGLALDGRGLAHGEKVRLRNGSAVDFCGQRFEAEITGEVEPDWVDPDQAHLMGDEAPSISAILADVSPVGRTATGILPGRLGADFLDIDAPAPSASRDQERISRTPIGWGGPPDAALLSGSATLPDDWHVDSGSSSRSEHIVATSTRVRMPVAMTPSLPAEPVTRSGPSAEDALDAFVRGLGEVGEVIEEPMAYLHRMGTELHAMRDAVRAMEDEMRDLLDELGEAPSTHHDSDLATRLDTVRRERERFVDAVRELLRDTDRLEPDAMERRSAVTNDEQSKLLDRLNPAATRMRRAWTLLRKTYRGSIADGSPRSRFTARLTGTSTPVDDEFEELHPDRPGDGGKVA